jgi:hypothetical protein
MNKNSTIATRGCTAVPNYIGDKLWYLDNRLHREGGPAIERANGDRLWYINGSLHREDGPSIEYADGTRQWFRNGQKHREDGPAVEFSSGHKEWWEHDKLIPAFAAEDTARAENKRRDIASMADSMCAGIARPITIWRPLKFRKHSPE